MNVNTDHLNRCISALAGAWAGLRQREAGELSYDIYRHAARHCLISGGACERWLEYHAARNETAHEYGERFAERTLELLPQFIADARALARVIERETGG